MHRLAARVHGHRHRHILHGELVDGLHAEVLEGHHARSTDRLRHEVGRTAHRHQVSGLVLADGLDADGPALGLADHGDETGLLEHHLGELVHARGGGGTRRSHDLVAHRIDRADVVDHAVAQVDTGRQALAAREQVGDALVGGVAAGEHAAREQQPLTGLPSGDLLRGQCIEVDAARFGRGLPVDLGPAREVGRLEPRRSAAVEREVHMPGGRAVRDHGDGLRGRVGREIEDLDVEHRRESAQALRADAERVDLVVELDAQFLELVLGAARLELGHVDGLHQGFFGEHHRLLGGPADADAEHAGRAPAGAHGGHGLQHPIDDGVGGVEHRELGLVL